MSLWLIGEELERISEVVSLEPDQTEQSDNKPKPLVSILTKQIKEI